MASAFPAVRFGSKMLPSSASSHPAHEHGVRPSSDSPPPVGDTFEGKSTEGKFAEGKSAQGPASSAAPSSGTNPEPAASQAQSSKNVTSWTKQDTKAAHAVFWKTVFPAALEFGAIASMPMLIGIPLAIASIPVCWMANKFGDSLLKGVDDSKLSKNGRHLYEWAKFGEDFFTDPKEIDRAKALFNNLLDDLFELPGVKILAAVPFVSAAKERLKQQNIDNLKHLVGGSSKFRGMDKYYMATLPKAWLKAKTPIGKACTFVKHAALIAFFKLSHLIGVFLKEGVSKVMPGVLKIPVLGMAEFMIKLNTLPALLEGVQVLFSKNPPSKAVA
jgi:hypothetical protein